MAQFVVRDLEESVKERLKRRAKHHGRSMEEEIRQILRHASRQFNPPLPKLGSRISTRFAKIGLTKALPELRGQTAKPADFRK